MESTCISCGFVLCKCLNLWGMSSQDFVQVSTYKKWPSASKPEPSDYFSSCPICLRTFAFAPPSAATFNQPVILLSSHIWNTAISQTDLDVMSRHPFCEVGGDVWVGTSWVVSSVNTLLLGWLASWCRFLCLETHKWIPGWQGPQTRLTSSLAWYVESSGKTLYV